MYALDLLFKPSTDEKVLANCKSEKLNCVEKKMQLSCMLWVGVKMGVVNAANVYVHSGAFRCCINLNQPLDGAFVNSFDSFRLFVKKKKF